MGAILDQTVARAVKLGFIPESDRQAVIDKIETISAKYGVSGDDFALFSMMETEGLNPRSINPYGCVGIIQFCPGGGLNATGLSSGQMAELSVLRQLDYVDKYFQQNNLKNGSNLADLYLTVLNPLSRAIKGIDENLNIPSLGAQAAALKTTCGGVSCITRRSLENGIRVLAAQKLGGPLPPSDPTLASNTGGKVPGDYKANTANGNGTVTGIISAVFNKACTEPFPKDFTIKEAIKYTGCKTKLASAQMGTTGIGYPAAGMQVQGQSATGLGGYAAGAPVCPGCLIYPFKERPVKYPITSGRSPNRWGRPHHGYDFGCPTGTPLLAAGDGVVVESKFNAGGYGWFITIDHKNGLFTRYGHMREQGLAIGVEVKQGQIIGYSNNTGGSTGEHLHFEVRTANDYSYESSLEPKEYCK